MYSTKEERIKLARGIKKMRMDARMKASFAAKAIGMDLAAYSKMEINGTGASKERYELMKKAYIEWCIDEVVSLNSRILNIENKINNIHKLSII